MATTLSEGLLITLIRSAMVVPELAGEIKALCLEHGVTDDHYERTAYVLTQTNTLASSLSPRAYGAATNRRAEDAAPHALVAPFTQATAPAIHGIYEQVLSAMPSKDDMRHGDAIYVSPDASLWYVKQSDSPDPKLLPANFRLFGVFDESVGNIIRPSDQPAPSVT